MSEEEIIRYCKALMEDMKMHYDVDNEVYIHENDYKAIEGLLDLYHKQKEENNKNYYEWRHLEAEVSNNYISKDEVLKALGYEENDEEYKRLYNKEEMILSLIRTINEECDRLEDIEDQKTMLEIHNIENQRDKYWQDKIREKIKQLEHTYQIEEEENGYNDETYMYYIPQIKVLKQMLGEL